MHSVSTRPALLTAGLALFTLTAGCRRPATPQGGTSVPAPAPVTTSAEERIRNDPNMRPEQKAAILDNLKHGRPQQP